MSNLLSDERQNRKHLIGPKPGCEVRFFPKRINFDPPIFLTNNGIIIKAFGKWFNMETNKVVSGPTFPSALVVMDRR